VNKLPVLLALDKRTAVLSADAANPRDEVRRVIFEYDQPARPRQSFFWTRAADARDRAVDRECGLVSVQQIDVRCNLLSQDTWIHRFREMYVESGLVRIDRGRRK
jgi:hypothetical protein